MNLLKQPNCSMNSSAIFVRDIGILTQEYETESYRFNLMTRSQDEIKRLADQLDDNEVRMKLQTEIRRLVDKIVLHMKIQKFIIYYHSMFKFLSKTKLNVRFKLLAGFRH